jgi:hypothetical protein
MTRQQEVCELPSRDLAARGFDPVSWWLEAHPGRVTGAVHSSKFIFDGHEITLQSNSARVMEYLSRQVTAHFPHPESGGCRGGCLIEIHVIDEKQEQTIDLPWGEGAQECGSVAFQPPLATIISDELRHFRWDDVEAFWRPSNLLASLEFSASIRIQILLAAVFQDAGDEPMRAERVKPIAVAGGMCFPPGSLGSAPTLEEIGDIVRNMVVRAHGHFCLHAATVSLGSQGALLMGPSGSGKTTTALALMRGGFQLLSDEHSFLDVSHGQARLSGFLSRPRLVGQAPAELAQLEETLNSEPGRKTAMELRELFSNPRDIQWVSPAAIFFLRIQPGQQEHQFKPISIEEAFVQLTSQILDPTNVFRKEEQAKATIQLVESCPAYELRLGRNLASLPELVRSMMGGAA